MERLREKHRVVTNVKDGALRLSMSFYNDEEDLERAVDALKQELRGKPAGPRTAPASATRNSDRARTAESVGDD
jgi:hypothetical protein